MAARKVGKQREERRGFGIGGRHAHQADDGQPGGARAGKGFGQESKPLPSA